MVRDILKRMGIALVVLVLDLSYAASALIGILFILWYFASPATANVNGVSAWIIGVSLVVLAIILATANEMLKGRRHPKRMDAPAKNSLD